MNLTDTPVVTLESQLATWSISGNLPETKPEKKLKAFKRVQKERKTVVLSTIGTLNNFSLDNLANIISERAVADDTLSHLNNDVKRLLVARHGDGFIIEFLKFSVDYLLKHELADDEKTTKLFYDTIILGKSKIDLRFRVLVAFELKILSDNMTMLAEKAYERSIIKHGNWSTSSTIDEHLVFTAYKTYTPEQITFITEISDWYEKLAASPSANSKKVYMALYHLLIQKYVKTSKVWILNGVSLNAKLNRIFYEKLVGYMDMINTTNTPLPKLSNMKHIMTILAFETAALVEENN